MTMRAIELAAEWAWRTSLATLPLIALALLATLILRRAMFTPIRWMLWVLVVARLLMPFAPSSRFSVFNFASTKISLAEIQLNQPSLSGLSAPNMEVPGVETPGYSRVVPAGTASGVAPREFIPLIWSLGVLAALGRIVLQHFKVRRWIRRGIPISEGTAFEVLDEATKISRTRRQIRLLEVKEISSPALFGFWRPTILLPPTVAHGSATRLRLVLLHEIAHVKRWDVLIKWLMILARALHWFNPLVWLSARRLTAEQELLCDRDVLRLVGAEEQRTYAETLLALAAGASGAPATVISLSANFKQLKERIGMIQQFKPGTRRWLMFLVPPLTAVVTVITFTAAMKKPVPPTSATVSAPEAAHSDKEKQALDRQRTEDRLRALREELDRLSAMLRDRRQQLTSMGMDLNIPRWAASEESLQESDLIRTLEKERVGAQRDLAQISELYERLKKKSRDELRRALPTAYHDDALDRYLADLAKTEQQLAIIQKDYSGEHPEVLRLTSLTKNIHAQIESRIDGIMSGLETLVSARRATVQSLDQKIVDIKIKEADRNNNSQGYFDLKRDIEAMQKVRDSLYIRYLQEEIESRVPGAALK